MFEYLEHTADIKIRVKESNEFDFFVDITKAVNSAIFDFKPSKYTKTKEFILDAKTYDQLIHDFIEELVYVANQEHSYTKLISISIEEKKTKLILNCKLNLCSAKPKDYKTEVKAVSFNVIYKEDSKTNEKVCEFVLDI